MILQQTSDGVLAIRQTDHAAFAGFLLEHWSDHNFSGDSERDKIIIATREHDNGWSALDDKPTLDPETRLPHDFRKVDADMAYDIWSRGSRTYIASDPFVALMITHHAYSLYELGHKRDPVWKRFFTEFAMQRAELRDGLGLSHPLVERAYSYLRMMDWFSLAYCMNGELGAGKSDQYAGYNYKRDGDQFLFRPYPFDHKDLHYELPVFRLKAEGYATDRDLRAAFKKPEMLQIVLNPLGRREK